MRGDGQLARISAGVARRCGSFFWRMREALEWLDGEDSALTRKVQSGKEQS